MRIGWAGFLVIAAALGVCAYQRADDRPTSKPAAAGGQAPAVAAKEASGKAKPLSGKPARPLLLLDDDGEAPLAKDAADNSRCQVCHLNMAQENMVTVHAKHKIGCANCHGACDAHIADESWASGGNGTAPDIMYPQEKINPSCKTCHALNKFDSERKCPFPTLTEKKVCTDCHGKHRLAKRKCKWK